jgi:hypothetical protein
MATKKADKSAKQIEPAKIGRPSKFTQEVADAICTRIADGESLRKICESDDMPAKTTVMRWLADEEQHKPFRDQYARAREEQADKLAEEIIEIADDGRNDTYKDAEGQIKVDHDVIARSRLRVDARKWYASKLAPKKYGDKLAVGGADDLPAVQITTIERIIVDPK